MTTALEICNGAAEEIGVKVSAQALEAEDFQAIFTRMNDMLLEWADLGLTPAFNEVTSGSDTVEIDGNARRAVKTNLAVYCAPAFDKIVTPSLFEMASRSLAALENSVNLIPEIAYPDTLPIGSGNECSNTDTYNRFFDINKQESF